MTEQQTESSPILSLSAVERMVRSILAYQAAPTAEGLVQVRRSPVIRSIRVSCRQDNKEVPLGPKSQLLPRYSTQGEPVPESFDSRGKVFELGIVPAGQPLVAEVFAELAVQVDVLLPGDPIWHRCEGSPPWRFEFAARYPGGVVRVIARNASNSDGVVGESIPLRVIRELDFRTLRFPGFTPASLQALADAITESRPIAAFYPPAVTDAAGKIESWTRDLVGASFVGLVDLQAAVGSITVPDGPRLPNADGGLRFSAPPHFPAWPHLDCPYPGPAAGFQIPSGVAFREGNPNE